MAINKLKISYSGSLNAYYPSKSSEGIIKFFKTFFWTYNNSNVDASTRSAYYLILAVRILKEKHNIKPELLQIALWGDIHAGNLDQIKSNQVEDYFEIEGYLQKEISLQKLQDSDLLFLPLEKSNSNEHRTLFIPGKLFEYLNTGKPILALCEPSDCRDILEQSGIGICVKPDDESAIAQTILSLIENPEKLHAFKPNSAFISQFSFDNKTAQLANVFNQLLNE